MCIHRFERDQSTLWFATECIKTSVCSQVHKRIKEWSQKIKTICEYWLRKSHIKEDQIESNIILMIVDLDVRVKSTKWHKYNEYHQYILSYIGLWAQYGSQCSIYCPWKLQKAMRRERKYRSKVGLPMKMPLCSLLPLATDNVYEQGMHWICYGHPFDEDICAEVGNNNLIVQNRMARFDLHGRSRSACSSESYYYLSMNMADVAKVPQYEDPENDFDFDMVSDWAYCTDEDDETEVSSTDWSEEEYETHAVSSTWLCNEDYFFR